MTAAECLTGASGFDPVSDLPSLHPKRTIQPEGRPVTWSPAQLRLHPVLDEIGWPNQIGELNNAALSMDRSVPEPILVTTNGTILAGFTRWQLAIFEGWHEIDCIEYRVSDQDCLHFILNHHQTRRGWNAFVRICVALALKPFLQQRALDNMRAGGKCKGWATLPDANRIDVRQEIARIAGTGARNVSNVEKIRESAHPRLIDALRNGTLKINGAIKLCKFSKAEQLEKFIRQSEDREIAKVIRKSIRSPREEKSNPDVVTTLEVLLQQEVMRPGSVDIRVGDSPHTVVVLGRDLLTGALAQRRLI
jgi:hypothetical protein